MRVAKRAVSAMNMMVECMVAVVVRGVPTVVKE